MATLHGTLRGTTLIEDSGRVTDMEDSVHPVETNSLPLDVCPN